MTEPVEFSVLSADYPLPSWVTDGHPAWPRSAKRLKQGTLTDAPLFLHDGKRVYIRVYPCRPNMQYILRSIKQFLNRLDVRTTCAENRPMRLAIEVTTEHPKPTKQMYYDRTDAAVRVMLYTLASMLTYHAKIGKLLAEIVVRRHRGWQSGLHLSLEFLPIPLGKPEQPILPTEAVLERAIP